MDAREQQVADIAAAIVADRGADVEYVTIRRAGRRSVVVVAVDADGGITLDDIADLTPGISDALDAADVMGETPYTLEVSSPGVHRPLTLPRHWRRAAGRLVRVQRADSSTLTGRVTSSDDSAVTLHVDGAEVGVPFSQIDKAVVQVEFGEGNG